MVSAGCRWARSGGALARDARRGGVLGFPVRDERCLGGRNVGARQRRAAGGRDLAGRHPVREVRGARFLGGDLLAELAICSSLR